jgi:hypothetical protein
LGLHLCNDAKKTTVHTSWLTQTIALKMWVW